MELVQQADDLDTLLDGGMLAGATGKQFDEKHDTDMNAIDDIMSKYDKQEKNE